MENAFVQPKNAFLVVKEKPVKGKLNTSFKTQEGIRKVERDQKLSATPKPSLNASSSSLTSMSKQEDNPTSSANATPPIRRIGIRRRHSSLREKFENSRASVEIDEEKEYVFLLLELFFEKCFVGIFQHDSEKLISTS